MGEKDSRGRSESPRQEMVDPAAFILKGMRGNDRSSAVRRACSIVHSEQGEDQSPLERQPWPLRYLPARLQGDLHAGRLTFQGGLPVRLQRVRRGRQIDAGTSCRRGERLSRGGKIVPLSRGRPRRDGLPSNQAGEITPYSALASATVAPKTITSRSLPLTEFGQ